MNPLHLIEGIAGIVVALIMGVVGYFRMYQPVAERLTRLEVRQDASDMTRTDNNARLILIMDKLDKLSSRVEVLYTALIGVDGTNGMRSRLIALENKVDENQDRLTVLEVTKDQT